MARSDRILLLLQTLRQYRRPVRGEQLAEDLSVSLRTLYRDIATLRAQGADIRGEPGMGYQLKSGFLLPTMMFSEEELEALILGTRWVAARGDGDLAQAARAAVARISAVLPAPLRDQIEENQLLIGPAEQVDGLAGDLKRLREAIRREQTLQFSYLDLSGQKSARRVWPFALGYFDQVRVLVAWCETRKDFRHFRADRISDLLETGERYPRRKAALLSEWRARQQAGASNAAADSS